MSLRRGLARLKRRGTRAHFILALAFERMLLLLRASQPFILLATLALVAYSLFSSQPWPYALHAQAGQISLSPVAAGQTRWSLEGATVCLRRAAAIEHSVPMTYSSDACSSARWVELDLSGFDDPMLQFEGVGRAGQAEVRFDLRLEGGLALSVRSADGGLSLVSASGQGAALGQEMIALFPAVGEAEAAWASERVFPFAGSVRIGNDARTGTSGLLRAGDLSIYTRSDDSISGRGLVDSVALLPGDRVELSTVAGAVSRPSRGFIHVDLLQPLPEQAAAGLSLVAFGHAEDVRIVRFGEQTQAFQPSLWARLSRNAVLGSWVAALLAVLGLMAVYREGSEIGSESRLQQLSQNLAESKPSPPARRGRRGRRR